MLAAWRTAHPDHQRERRRENIAAYLERDRQVDKRAVKTERLAGRLIYRKVAGKVRIGWDDFQAYRRQQRVARCPLDRNRDPQADPGESREGQSSRRASTRTPRPAPGTSSGTMDVVTDALALAREIRSGRSGN
jgi:hypothetical protein